MKLSELIAKLEKLQQHVGDSNVYFVTRDAYSRYGEKMELPLEVGENTGLPSDYSGFASDGNGVTTLLFHLKERDGKNPKITFRP